MSRLNFIRRPLRSMCLLSLVLLGASACKPVDDPDDGDQPATPIESDDAPDVLAKQICAQVFACECPNTLDYTDEAACVAAVTGELAGQIDPVLDAGGSWDPECAGQMAKALADWECLGQNTAAREATFSPLTCPVLKGVLGAGNSCNRSVLGDDCQAGLACISGTCIPTPTLPLQNGENCSYGNLPCGSGSYCDWDASFDVQICQPLQEAGDACTEDQYLCGPQGSDLVCTAGICTPTPGEGESCEEFLLCGPGLYCDGGQDFTCQPRRELGDGCGADAVCPVDASCIGNICEADAAAVCSATDLL
jgi:Dickkopf N-terminal cysteine-rich region